MQALNYLWNLGENLMGGATKGGVLLNCHFAVIKAFSSHEIFHRQVYTKARASMMEN